MTEQEQLLKRVQDKLQQLIKQFRLLQKENLQLKNESEKAKQQQAEQITTIDNLKQQVEILRMSSGSWNQKDKKEFEKRINHYIKEIDRCIALLGE